MVKVDPNEVDESTLKYKGGSLDSCLAESFAYGWNGELDTLEINHGRSLTHEFGYESFAKISTGAYALLIHQLPSDVVFLALERESHQIGGVGFTNKETALDIITDILLLGGEIKQSCPLFENEYVVSPN